MNEENDPPQGDLPPAAEQFRAKVQAALNAHM